MQITSKIVGAVTKHQMGILDETDLGDLTSVQPFANSAEEQAAFGDPRYKHDQLYRLEVARRAAATSETQASASPFILNK